MPGTERGDTGEYVEATAADDVLTAMRDMDAPFATNKDVAEAVGCSPDTARRKLTELHEDGPVERRKVGANAVVWWIPDTGKMEHISRRNDDDYFANNPGWADDLPNLGENA
jgi:predicted transcriptional regulator